MSESNCRAAIELLGAFLRLDMHYLDSSEAYGDGGEDSLERAMKMFLARPELGFVWIGMEDSRCVAVCVISYAISTSAGGLVVKMDDVFVSPESRGQGIGSRHLNALIEALRAEGVSRIDTSVHHENPGAERFYLRNGFVSLNEERLSLLIGNNPT